MKAVPKLRFKEFKASWYKTKLADITTKISDGLHSTPNYDENGEYYFVNGNNLIDDKIYFAENTKRVNKEEYLKHRKELSGRTILISINGTIGSLALYNDEKIILGKSACYINVNNDTDKYFIYNSLQTTKIKNFFTSELTGSTIKNLSLTTIKNCEFGFPTLPEQQKIASFLSAIDEKIQQLTRKKELLEQYKKGVMQQLFMSESGFAGLVDEQDGEGKEILSILKSGKSRFRQLRFKDENGKAYPKWEEKRLGDVCDSISSGKSKSIDNGSFPLYGSTGIIGSCQDCSHDGVFILIARVGANAGTINLVEGKFGVSDNTLVVICNKQLNIEYIYFYLEFYNLNKLIFGSGQPLITGGQLKDLNLNLPSLPEQQKIASYLSSLDTKIESVATQIAQSQAFKKGLLQQMFV